MRESERKWFSGLKPLLQTLTHYGRIVVGACETPPLFRAHFMCPYRWLVKHTRFFRRISCAPTTTDVGYRQFGHFVLPRSLSQKLKGCPQSSHKPCARLWTLNSSMRLRSSSSCNRRFISSSSCNRRFISACHCSKSCKSWSISASDNDALSPYLQSIGGTYHSLMVLS